jgi:hypothetical protein
VAALSAGPLCSWPVNAGSGAERVPAADGVPPAPVTGVEPLACAGVEVVCAGWVCGVGAPLTDTVLVLEPHPASATPRAATVRAIPRVGTLRLG